MKKVLLFSILLFVTVFALLFFTKDTLIGVLLEKYAVRRCNKLSGETCEIASREQSGQMLRLKNVQLGEIASAEKITVAWNYHLSLPLVTFDVVISNLEGNAQSLPLYAVWNLIKEDGKRRALCLNSWKFENTTLHTSKGKISLNGLLEAEPMAIANIEAKLEHNGLIHAHIKNRKLNFSLIHVSIEQAMALAESWNAIKWPLQNFFLEGEGELDLQTKEYHGKYQSLEITLPNPNHKADLSGQFRGNSGKVLFSGLIDNHVDKLFYTIEYTLKTMPKAQFKGENIHLESWLPAVPFQLAALGDIKGEMQNNTILADLTLKKLYAKQQSPELEFIAERNAFKQCALCWNLSSHQLQGYLVLENGNLSGVNISANCSLNGNHCMLSNLQFGSNNELNLSDLVDSSEISGKLKLNPDTSIMLEIQPKGVQVSGALKGTFSDTSWNDYLVKAKGQFLINLHNNEFEVQKFEGKLAIGKISGNKILGSWTKQGLFNIRELQGFKAPLMSIQLAQSPFKLDFKSKSVNGVFLVQAIAGKPLQLYLDGEWKKPIINIVSAHADSH